MAKKNSKRSRWPEWMNEGPLLLLGLGMVLLLGRLLLFGQIETQQHFHTFVAGARMLWTGQDPYEVDVGYGGDYWFYSPACGLFFYGLIAYLPAWFAALLYSGGSLAILFVGVRKFSQAFKLHFEWMHAAIALSFLAGAVPWFKLEIFATGVLLFAVGAFVDGDEVWIPGLLLAAITQFKGQTLPTLGLLALAFKPDLRWRRLGATLIGGVGALFLAPALRFGWSANLALHSHWIHSLSASTSARWRTMENIYRALQTLWPNVWVHGVGYRWTLLGIGLWLAALQVWRRLQGAKTLLLDATALGAGYAVVFGPLQQNNAYVLALPLLLAIQNRAVLIASFLVYGLAYSVSWPTGLAGFAYQYSIKTWWSLALGLGFALSLWLNRGWMKRFRL